MSSALSKGWQNSEGNNQHMVGSIDDHILQRRTSTSSTDSQEEEDQCQPQHGFDYEGGLLLLSAARSHN